MKVPALFLMNQHINYRLLNGTRNQVFPDFKS